MVSVFYFPLELSTHYITSDPIGHLIRLHPFRPSLSLSLSLPSYLTTRPSVLLRHWNPETPPSTFLPGSKDYRKYKDEDTSSKRVHRHSGRRRNVI